MTPPEQPARASHVALPGKKWAFWPVVALRGAGFPAAGADMFASPELASMADNLSAAESDDEQAWLRYRAAFEPEMGRISSRILELVRERDFGLALAWQNHNVFDTAIAPMLRNHSGRQARRNSQQRQHEELIANYWLRYCLKNDTVGFFGPVGWASLDSTATISRLRSGEKLVASSEVFFEAWAIDQLAATIGAEPGMAPWIPPRRLPYVRLAQRHAIGPDGVRVGLTEAEAAVLGRCNGQLPACDIARELEAAGLADIYTIIAELRRKRLLTWKLELPLSPRPERYLRRFLRQVGDQALAADGLERLDLLEAARETARIASGGEPAGFVSALLDLDKTFMKVAQAPPSRRRGQAYGGRTLIYHDARRDTELVLGADFLVAAQPLELLFESARWLTYHFGARLRKLFAELAAKLTVNGVAPDLATFRFECLPLIYRSARAITSELQRDFQQRWAEILRISPAGRRVHLHGSDLRAAVHQAFDAPHSGWSDGRYCSPDLMIAADGVDAINRGDFELVLGEIHMAIASSQHYCFVTQHPDPGHLIDCVTVDSPGPRLLPVLPKESRERLTIRTQPALTRDMDFLVALSDQTADPNRPRLFNGADLAVTPGPAGPVVTLPDGPSFQVIDIFSRMLLPAFMDSLEFMPDAAYHPRITIDRLVIVRESWHLEVSGIDFARLRDEAARFAAARHWRRAVGLPRRVFVKSPGEAKPFYADFDSVISVNVLSKTIRRLQAKCLDDLGIRIKISEMLPSVDKLWLTDAAGRRYTSELRMVAVDQLHIAEGADHDRL